ncbi:MAG: DUF1641 domain-containing protein [bacterium]
MDDKDIQKQLTEINEKLNFLTEPMQIQARRQREMQELKDDLSRIATDFTQTAILELDEVSQHFDTNDLLHLVKKLLRNTRNLTALLDKVESTGTFLEDATPIARQAFLDLLQTLNELDRKGYFAFFREVGMVLDRIVTAFSVEDVKALWDNIVTILNTVKNLTQPDMLSAMNNAISVYKHLDFVVEKDVSYWQIARQLKSPEMKQGIALGVEFLKSLSKDRQKTLTIQITIKK